MAKPRFIGYDATGAKTQKNQLLDIINRYSKYADNIAFDECEETGYIVNYADLEGRIDVEHYSPDFIKLKNKIEHSQYPVISIGDICISIKSGFAAGKSDQATEQECEKVPHLRPFSITPEGQLSFETQKYVPVDKLDASDFCEQGEVLFNNTNSIDLVGKSTVFDIDYPCATSNHITRLKLKEIADPYYIAAFFNMLLRLGYWKFLCTNFNNQSGINVDTLKKVKIVLPPLNIQKQIASELQAKQESASILRKKAEIEIALMQQEFESSVLGK